jgi:cytoskeletal protein RodZ
MPDTLGKLLENARKAKGLSPEDIMARTRISVRFIKAAESDRFEELPGEVFIKGFLRSYARELDLDGDDLLDHYGRLGITAQDNSPELISMPLKRTPMGPKVALYAATLALATVVGAVYYFFGAPPVAPPAPTFSEIGTLLPTDAATATDATPPLPTVEPTVEPTPRPAPPSDDTGEAADPAKDPTRPLKLVIDATGDTWLKVTVDGEYEREIILREGKSAVWYAEERFSLSVGNLVGTKVRLNGEPVELPKASSNVITNFALPRP